MDGACKRYCSVPMCQTYKTKAVTLHRFPPDPVLREKWREILMIHKPISKFMCVCSKHFKAEDYSRATTSPKMKRLLQGVIPSLNLPDDVLEIKAKQFGNVANMTSHQAPSTSKSSAPPVKRARLGEETGARRKILQASESTLQSSGPQTFDAVIIKDEAEDNGANQTISEIKIEEDEDSDDAKIKVEIEDGDNVTSFSLVTKIEVKEEDDEEDSESFSDESQNLELKEEELIIKEETDEEEEEEEYEAPSTSSASTQTDNSCEDKHSMISQEVERLLAQLGAKKKTVRGPKAQFTDNDVFQFTITLLRGKGAPKIWRRFQVPTTYTFRQFHIAIQKAMGWKSVEYDYHLHAFRLINPTSGFEDSIVISEDVGLYCGAKDENVTKIKDYFTIVNHKGRYEYDFGIGWEHEYIFEGAFPRVDGRTYPICLEGAKACPPEDGVVDSDEEYDSDAFDAEVCF